MKGEINLNQIIIIVQKMKQSVLQTSSQSEITFEGTHILN
jgi:hypothetical protein